jgi:hypothetical protein
MIEERRRDEHADDALVEAAWRNASHDEPPARLDAAILAAARDATRRPAPGREIAPRRAWWTRWQPLAAAAGVAGLAFVLVQTIPREAPLPSPAAVEMKSRAESTISQPSVPEVAPAERNAAQASDAAPAILPSARTRESAASPAAEDASAGGDALVGVAPQAAARAAAATPTPDTWARRIAALHAAGNLDSAAAELREFRRAFPDADRFLPDDLRAWAAGVPGPDAP